MPSLCCSRNYRVRSRLSPFMAQMMTHSVTNENRCLSGEKVFTSSFAFWHCSASFFMFG
jgi:hypothetical protein